MVLIVAVPERFASSTSSPRNSEGMLTPEKRMWEAMN